MEEVELDEEGAGLAGSGVEEPHAVRARALAASNPMRERVLVGVTMIIASLGEY